MALIQTCPSAHVRIEEGQCCAVVVDIKPQLASQAEMWIDTAVQGWRRRQAHLRMPEYVRLLGQEWSKQGMQQGGKDVTRQLQMRVAESMRRLKGVQAGREDI